MGEWLEQHLSDRESNNLEAAKGVAWEKLDMSVTELRVVESRPFVLTR